MNVKQLAERMGAEVKQLEFALEMPCRACKKMGGTEPPCEKCEAAVIVRVNG